jgi:AbrB family looped-hinge helix DNA binding protein
VRLNKRWQVTIPAAVRTELGLRPGDELDFVVANGEAHLVRVPPGGRGRRVVERLRGRGDVRMSTEEIMALTRGVRRAQRASRIANP